MRFDVLSDIQGDMDDLEAALAALAEFGPADHLFVVGDLTSNGRVRQYRELMSRLDGLPALYVIGNHDFYNGRSSKVSIERFLEFTGMPSLYSAHDVGVPVLRLGTVDGSERTGHYVVLGEEQRAWLASELDRLSGPVIVLSHHPLPHTVSGTYDDLETQAPKMYGRDYAEAAQLLEILGAHPNVVLLSGHSHWNLERSDWVTWRAVDGLPGFAAANKGAVQTGFGPDGSGGERPFEGPFNQGLRVVVGDSVRIHALDFVTRRVLHSVEIDDGIRDLGPVAWEAALS